MILLWKTSLTDLTIMQTRVHHVGTKNNQFSPLEN